MKYNFRKISASDIQYIKNKEKIKKLLHDFSEFMSVENKKNKKDIKNSGKIASYTGYLIRLIIILDEQYDFDNNYESSYFHEKLTALQVREDFKIYNLNESRFPNATINTFSRFIESK